jgi:hypothetical protein
MRCYPPRYASQRGSLRPSVPDLTYVARLSAVRRPEGKARRPRIVSISREEQLAIGDTPPRKIATYVGSGTLDAGTLYAPALLA